jgi:hypothetical protein
MGSVDAITALVYPASEALLQCLFVLKFRLCFTRFKIGYIVVFGAGNEMDPGVTEVVESRLEDTKGRTGGKIGIESHITWASHLLRTTHHQVGHRGDHGRRLTVPPEIGPQPLDAFMELSP